jgi:hypothetical protein
MVLYLFTALAALAVKTLGRKEQKMMNRLIEINSLLLDETQRSFRAVGTVICSSLKASFTP